MILRLYKICYNLSKTSTLRLLFFYKPIEHDIDLEDQIGSITHHAFSDWYDIQLINYFEIKMYVQNM